MYKNHEGRGLWLKDLIREPLLLYRYCESFDQKVKIHI